MTSANDIASGARAAAEVLKDDANAKAAVGELGQSLHTITKFVNHALLPIAALNYGFEKARVYFSERFASDLGAIASTIPKEHVQAPRASIAAPALQGLAFSHEEPDLKAMYLHLLKTAMDARRADLAHPAFVEIIRQLSAEEAALLRSVCDGREVPIVEVRRIETKTGHFAILRRHLGNLTDDKTKQPDCNPRQAMIIDNWVRLGLIDATYGAQLTYDGAYAWVEGRPELAELRAKYKTPQNEITAVRGYFKLNDLGRRFVDAVGATDERSTTPI